MIKRKLKFSVFSFLALLLTLSPVSFVFAQGGLGHGFYGTAKIADVDAEIGRVVSAQVGETEYGSCEVTTPGHYALIVQGDIEDGATIDFYVDGQKADQTFPFHDGWTTELNLTAAAPTEPTIAFSPTSFSFSATEGGANPANKTLEIWNSGTGTLGWSVSDDADWLSLSPTSGSSTGEHDSVTVLVNIIGMSAGDYSAVITISALGATITQQTVPVVLRIGTSAQPVDTATDTGTATVASSSGSITGLAAVDEATLPEEGKPDIEFPHGFFSFNIGGITPGSSVTVTITFPSVMPPDTQYWKYHDPEGWVDVTSLLGDNDGDDVLTLTLTDGGLGDDDAAKNGVIVDPGAPGIPPPTYYTLTVTRAPAEGGSASLDPSQPAEGYEAGTSVQLTATANEGYAFGSWSGDLTGSTNPDTITMDSDKSVTANFVLSPPPPPPPPPPTYYSLTVTCDPTEGGSVTLDPTQPPGGYEADTTVELTAIANEAYAFGSWSSDLTGSTNPDTITMDSDKSVTANFVSFTAPADVAVSAADPGVDSIDVSTIDLSEVDTTNMPEIVEAQEAYVVDSTGTGSFTLRFTGIANASNIVVYKVVDSTWTEIPITAITVIDSTTVEVTMEVGDPILVFGLPTGIPPEPWDPWSYDENGDGYIQKSEAISAVEDYFDGVITKEQAIEVVSLYFEYVWDPWSYDENGDGEIQKSEAITAVEDYFDGVITKEQAIEVVSLYFG